VFLLLLVAVALIGMHSGHFNSGALAQLQLQPPQMPRRMGLATAAADTALPYDSLVTLTSDSEVYYSGSNKTLSFDLCGGFAQQRVALVSGEPISLVPPMVSHFKS
jgi:hypothetical protein